MKTREESPLTDAITYGIIALMMIIVANEVYKRVNTPPRVAPQARREYKPVTIPTLVTISSWR